MDVGTPDGAVLVELLQRHRHLTGGGFGPQAARLPFCQNVAAAGLSERLQYHVGDILRDPLPTADVLIIGALLQALTWAQRTAVLQDAYRAVPPDGAVVLHGRMIDEHASDPGTPDWRDMLQRTGFRSAYQEQLTGDHWMTVAVR